MARDTLTGSRIRERRVLRGMKQADLAREAGISASYLNLIEHNRRRIGGKLILVIAEILGVEPAVLTEGAGAALIASLREAAADRPQAAAELDRVDEFAGRFPGWAQILADNQGRIVQLERSLEALNDRMTHDPHLAASLHEMLSTVTAIRSAASILAEPGDVDAEWQARFHRNIYEDSARLAETSRSLVGYLEADDTSALETGAPQEEVDVVLDEAGHTVPELEDGLSVSDAMGRLASNVSEPARLILQGWLERYEADARAVPLDMLEPAVTELGLDPARLASRLSADPALIMRRLAAMPHDRLPTPVGLAICDSSGVLTYRKPLPDFPMPRFGAACPLWPLYRALSRPHVILAGPVMQAGRGGAALWTEALATPTSGPAVNADPLYQAQMMVRPLPLGVDPAADLPQLGMACRLCPLEACQGRREPSILASAGRS